MEASLLLIGRTSRADSLNACSAWWATILINP